MSIFDGYAITRHMNTPIYRTKIQILFIILHDLLFLLLIE